MSKAALGAILCSLAIGAATLSGAHDSDKTIAHVLNRVAFGARPGDLERVRAIGVARYIDDQLHPERLADPAMDTRLAEFATLRMTSREIAEQFEIPQLKARLEKRRAAANTPGDSAGNQLPAQPNPEEQRRANQVVMELSEQKLLRASCRRCSSTSGSTTSTSMREKAPPDFC